MRNIMSKMAAVFLAGALVFSGNVKAAALPEADTTTRATEVVSDASYWSSFRKDNSNMAIVDTKLPTGDTAVIEKWKTDGLGVGSIMTAIIPPIKAPACTPKVPTLKRMARAAPIQAPEDTPSKSGATRGFWKTP